MATAYVPGPSLSDYVHGYGPLPEPAAWRLAAGLAEALLAVHACGLVHRDLKPSNVLLAVDGPRVIDFGIASALEVTGLTTTGSVMGSPPYMSPEQAMGMPTGPASDVFALGSTLAFAAGGAPPFGDGEAHSLLFRVVHMAPALDTVPERLRAVVAACLAKDPAARPTLPQLLRACQDGAAAGGNSAASFWPRQMTAVIAGYRGRPDRARHPAVRQRPGGRWPGGQRGPHPPTLAAAPRVDPAGPRPGRTGQRHRPPPRAVRARRAGRRGRARGGRLGTRALRQQRGPPGRARAGRLGTPDRRRRCAPVAAISDDGRPSTSAATTALCMPSTRPPADRYRTFRTGGAVSGGVTVASGTLLVGSADGKVHAFPAGDGGASWAYPTGAAVAGAGRRRPAGSSTPAATTTTSTPLTPAPASGNGGP